MRALDALDVGRPAEAARGFAAAGELAPDAPVWRVHAGVALGRTGGTAAARRMFHEALARGYPPSDLAALDPLGACVVSEGAFDLSLRESWSVVTAHGLTAFRGDTRSARFVPSPGGTAGRATHLIGHFETLGESGDRYHIDSYAVDPATGVVTVVERPWAQGFVARYPHPLTFRNDHEPWPRAIPLVRALRSGLLADGLEWVDDTTPTLHALEQDELVHRVVDTRGHRREPQTLRFSRQAWAGTPALPAAIASDVVALTVDDKAALARVDTVLGQLRHGPRRLWHITAPGAPTDGLHVTFLVRPVAREAALVLLDLGAGAVIAELALPREWNTLGAVADVLAGADIAHDASTETFVVSLRLGDGAVVAFDSRAGHMRWQRTFPRSVEGAAEARPTVSLRGPLCLLRGVGGLHDVLLDTFDGTVRLDASRRGLEQVRLSDDLAFIVAQGEDALFVFDGRDRGAPFEPLLTLWRHGKGYVGAACDGTWTVPESALATARVLIDDTLVPAAPLAPWLLDPLHVRSLGADEDKAPRRFPR